MRLRILHVPDCPNLARLEQLIHEALVGSEVHVSVTRQVVHSSEEAMAVGMAGSPTLLVDGIDPFVERGSAANLSCRLFRGQDGRAAGTPSITDLGRVLGLATGHTAAGGDSPGA